MVEPPPSLLLCSTRFDLHRATCFDLRRATCFDDFFVDLRQATCFDDLLRQPASASCRQEILAPNSCSFHLNKQQEDCFDNLPNPRLLLFFRRFTSTKNERKRSFQSLETPFKGCLDQKITRDPSRRSSLFPYHRKFLLSVASNLLVSAGLFLRLS